TDLAKITKKWPKPDKIEHEIVKNAQKPDSKTFFVMMQFDWPNRVSKDQGNTSSQNNYTKSFVKEAQARNKTDCHAGNPCEPNSHPTAMIRVQQKDPEAMKAINRAIQLRVLCVILV
nr:hypothetical protein [Tanacetum cinerariifolium]